MKKNRYLIALQRRRSLVALVGGLIVSFFTFAAVIMGILEAPTALTPERGGTIVFHLFTVNSNLLSGVGAFLMLPYAVEGIQKKQFRVPKWIMVLQYSGTVCVTLTLIFAMVLILPINGKSAVIGMNLWLHVVCPLMAIVLLCSTETDKVFVRRDTLIALLPFLCYMTVYAYMVFFRRDSAGGWRDIYRMGEYIPFWLAAPLMLLITWGIALGYRYLHNRLIRSAARKLQACWADTIDPVEVKIEVFGLGNYLGHFARASDVYIPLDILTLLSVRYDIPLKTLVEVFVAGVMNEYENLLRARKQASRVRPAGRASDEQEDISIIKQLKKQK